VKEEHPKMSEICDEITDKIVALTHARNKVANSNAVNTSAGHKLTQNISRLISKMNKLKPDEMSTEEIVAVTEEANDLILRSSSSIYT
jgi:hypothetical protein